jgi:hypothetical protein
MLIRSGAVKPILLSFQQLEFTMNKIHNGALL